MINNLSIAIHAFAMRMFTLLSINKLLLPRFGNWSNNFIGLPLKVEITPHLKHELCFIYVHIEAKASCCLFQTMQLGYVFGWCIYDKH